MNWEQQQQQQPQATIVVTHNERFEWERKKNKIIFDQKEIQYSRFDIQISSFHSLWFRSRRERKLKKKKRNPIFFPHEIIVTKNFIEIKIEIFNKKFFFQIN